MVLGERGPREVHPQTPKRPKHDVGRWITRPRLRSRPTQSTANNLSRHSQHVSAPNTATARMASTHSGAKTPPGRMPSFPSHTHSCRASVANLGACYTDGFNKQQQKKHKTTDSGSLSRSQPGDPLSAQKKARATREYPTPGAQTFVGSSTGLQGMYQVRLLAIFASG